MKLHIEELAGPEALEAITSEWELLDTQLALRTPFTSPLWTKLWLRHCRQERLTLRQEFFIHIARDETGELIAVLPLMITHRPGYGPLRMRVLQFVGAADGNVTEHRCMICRENDEVQVAQALADYLTIRKHKWDFFLWTGLRGKLIDPDHSPGDQLRIIRKAPYYLVDLPDSWESFRAGLSPNMKEALRKCYKHLFRDGHIFKLRVVTRPEDTSTSIERFFAMHAERAQFKSSTLHRDYFAKVEHRAFISDLAKLMAARNQLRIFELEVDGEIVASRVGFLLGDVLYLYYSGYDLAWRKHSVMTTLISECFKWAIESGVNVVNLSKFADPSKLRWRAREAMFYDSVMVSPTAWGRLIFACGKIRVVPSPSYQRLRRAALLRLREIHARTP